MDDAWKFETVDLTGCDREPIHICGAIQPHGVLLAMDRRDFVIRQWAGDTLFFLGVELGRPSCSGSYRAADICRLTQRSAPTAILSSWSLKPPAEAR